MFGGNSFVSLGGAGGQVKLAQAPTYPPAPAAAPAPAPTPPPAQVAPTPVATPAPAVTAGMSHGTQVAIAATVFGLSILGAIFLTD